MSMCPTLVVSSKAPRQGMLALLTFRSTRLRRRHADISNHMGENCIVSILGVCAIYSLVVLSQHDITESHALTHLRNQIRVLVAY